MEVGWRRVLAFRDSVKRGEAIGPRVLTAGPYFDQYTDATLQTIAAVSNVTDTLIVP